MIKPLSLKCLKNAFELAVVNSGWPDSIYMDPGVMAAINFGIDSVVTETSIQIKIHFTGINACPGTPDYDDYYVLSQAAQAFYRIGLDKAKYDRGFTLTKKK